MTFGKMKLKEDSTSTVFFVQHYAIATLCNMLLSSVYRICIACFMVTLNVIKATMKSIEKRKQNVEDIENIGNDYISSQIGVKREKKQKKKYSSTFNDLSCTSNVWYARTKVNRGLLRARTNKNIQAKPLEFQHQSHMNFARNVEIPKHLRFMTCPSDNRNTTTIKILSGTKSPHKCCIGNPFQNYTAVVSKLHDGVKTIDKTLGHNPRNVERASRKPYQRFVRYQPITRNNDIQSNCNSLYGQRCLEVILELEED